MNSAMRPIFNIKIAEKKMFVGLVNNARDPLVWHKATETHLKKKRQMHTLFQFGLCFQTTIFSF